MKQLILTLFLFFSTPTHAVIHPILNPDMRERGICLETLEKWLTPQAREQAYSGEFYADFLSPKLFMNGKFKPNCIKLKQLERTEDAISRIFFLYINPHCLDPSLPYKYRLKFVIKVPDPSDDDLREFNESNDKNEIVSWEETNQQEIEDMELVTRAYQGKALRLKKFPVLAIPEMHFRLVGLKGQTEFLSVLHAAKGYDLHNVLFDLSLDEIRQAYEAFGEKLGTMHCHFMDKNTIYRGEALPDSEAIPAFDAREKFYKTRTHGDLHAPNVFYDFRRDRITFIDFESMIFSLKHSGLSIQYDLEPILFRHLLHGKLLQNMTENTRERLLTAYSYFLCNYIYAYPQNQILYLIDYLENFLELHMMTRHVDDPFDYTLHELNAKERIELTIILERLIQNLDSIRENFSHHFYKKELKLPDRFKKLKLLDILSARSQRKAELQTKPVDKSTEDELTKPPSSGDTSCHENK